MTLNEALRTDRLIDIVTIGARTGLPRTTEIWFTNINGRIVICGTPSADGSFGPRRGRSWLANLRANANFEFCFKESLVCCIPAKAIEVTDPEERRWIMSAPQTQWYREQGFTVQDLVDGSPIVDVIFLGAHASLNAKSC